MNDILHDDFKFTMHSSGNVLSKSDVVGWAMSDDINSDKDRIVYENDEIAVHHSFVTFNDGNTQAVISVFKMRKWQNCFFRNRCNQYAKIKKVELKVPLLN